MVLKQVLTHKVIQSSSVCWGSRATQRANPHLCVLQNWSFALLLLWGHWASFQKLHQRIFIVLCCRLDSLKEQFQTTVRATTGLGDVCQPQRCDVGTSWPSLTPPITSVCPTWGLDSWGTTMEPKEILHWFIVSVFLHLFPQPRLGMSLKHSSHTGFKTFGSYKEV